MIDRPSSDTVFIWLSWRTTGVRRRMKGVSQGPFPFPGGLVSAQVGGPVGRVGRRAGGRACGQTGAFPACRSVPSFLCLPISPSVSPCLSLPSGSTYISRFPSLLVSLSLLIHYVFLIFFVYHYIYIYIFVYLFFPFVVFFFLYIYIYI